MSYPAITAIVVSRGLDALLRACLESLQAALEEAGGGERHRVVVVDNASPFPYRTETLAAPPPQLLRFDLHRSFARANNAAVQRFPNEVYLLVNNDVLLARSAIVRAAELMEREPGCGICGFRLVFPDATIQHHGIVFAAAGRGPYHRDRGRPSHLVARSNGEWQAVTGACVLIRAELWDELAGLDESFPFGLEDVDFCLRARALGARVMCCEDVDSLHFESMTPGRIELDVPSRRLFNERWEGRYAIDG